MPAIAEIRPLTTESVGQDHLGRFTAGNKLAKGNPHAKKVARNRSVLMDCVTEDDVRKYYRKLMNKIDDGDMQALKEFRETFIGKVSGFDEVENAAHIVQMYLQQTIHNHAAPALAPHLDGRVIDAQVIPTPTLEPTEPDADQPQGE